MTSDSDYDLQLEYIPIKGIYQGNFLSTRMGNYYFSVIQYNALSGIQD